MTHGEAALITRHGKPTAVLMDYREWQRLTRVPSFARLLTAAPLEPGDLPERDHTPSRAFPGVTGYLLDTNVISEIAPGRPNRNIAALRWLEARTDDLFISVVTVAEIEAGITFAAHREAHPKPPY